MKDGRPLWSLSGSLLLHGLALAAAIALVSRQSPLPALLVELQEAVRVSQMTPAAPPSRGDAQSPRVRLRPSPPLPGAAPVVTPPENPEPPSPVEPSPGDSSSAPAEGLAPLSPPAPGPAMEPTRPAHVSPLAAGPVTATLGPASASPAAPGPVRTALDSPHASPLAPGPARNAPGPAPAAEGGSAGGVSEAITGGIPGGGPLAMVAPSGRGVGEGGVSRGAPTGAGEGEGGVPPEFGPYLARFRQRIQESLAYPLAARRRGLAGTVQLEAELLPSGQVGSVVVRSSSLHAILDEAAVDTVRGLSPLPFPPGIPPRPLRVRLPIVFELK